MAGMIAPGHGAVASRVLSPGPAAGIFTPMPADHTITEAQVRHVAKLSRLELDDGQIHHFADQLSQILDMVAQIEDLDLEGVEPMAHPLDLTNVLREDRERPGLTPEQALANAPDRDPPFFKVPKVLGDGGGA